MTLEEVSKNRTLLIELKNIDYNVQVFDDGTYFAYSYKHGGISIPYQWSVVDGNIYIIHDTMFHGAVKVEKSWSNAIIRELAHQAEKILIGDI